MESDALAIAVGVLVFLTFCSIGALTYGHSLRREENLQRARMLDGESEEYTIRATSFFRQRADDDDPFVVSDTVYRPRAVTDLPPVEE